MGRLRRTRLCNLAEPFHDCNDIAGNLRPTDFLHPQSTPHPSCGRGFISKPWCDIGKRCRLGRCLDRLGTGREPWKQMRPFGETNAGRIDAGGPPIILKPNAVQHLGLDLHELATNASKHRALSGPHGEVLIRWQVNDTDDKVRIHWCEKGGPPVIPPTRRGFGHVVIEQIGPRALDHHRFAGFHYARGINPSSELSHRDAETSHQDSGDEGNDHHLQVGCATSAVNRMAHGSPPDAFLSWPNVQSRTSRIWWPGGIGLRT
jgi:hypothetical protein